MNNLVIMERGWLPIHGSMVNLYLKDGRKKTLIFMGSIHINAEGKLVAESTEIGAFVRLDDLDQATAYKELDRSFFFHPDKKNARVVMPAAPYKTAVR